MEKKCSTCQKTMPLQEFGSDRSKRDGKNSRCKECAREHGRAQHITNGENRRAAVARWRAKNLDKIKEYAEAHRAEAAERNRKWQEMNRTRCAEKSKRYRERHPEKIKAYSQKYWAENAGKISEYKKRYRQENPHIARQEGERRRKNPKYRIEATVRARLHRSVTKPGSCRTFEALGYTSDELKAHIERQFQKGMSWDNYGDWHIDHILPLSSFEYATTDDAEFKHAWALTNLRPLWADENQAKSSKRILLI